LPKFSLMSAFTNSGRSNALEITYMTGRFRPKAEVRETAQNDTAQFF